MEPALVRLIGLPRRAKRVLWVTVDLLMMPVLLWAALAIRYESLHPAVLPGIPFGPLGVTLLAAGALSSAGVYRSVTRAFDERFLQALLVAVGLVVVVLTVGAEMRWLPLPRSVPFIFGFFVFLAVWASRSVVRRSVRVLSRIDVPVARVAIYGAGSAGRQLLAALRSAPEYVPMAFFDDNREMVGAMVQGVRVFRGTDFVRVAQALHIDEVLIALPSASKARRREVIEHIEPSHVRVRTLPGISDLVGGKVSMADVQDVDIGDLLGRDAVPPSHELISRDICGKRVMVTGGGGSIGSELCRQVLAERPHVLVIVELNELALYNINQELADKCGDVKVVPVLGSVLDDERMTRVMSQHAIQTVYHAAAYKHVPLVEENPFEGINNNAVGTWRLARAASNAGVASFVLVSTDKAVRPTSVMGASKRLAELALQAFATELKTRTKFSMVRFGNVLGSSGSVVPLFREQIARGGPVTITHPDVTRYFMTIPEAAQLVIQAGAMSQGGDVFVLDMGEPVRIIDLAQKMIRLCGKSVRSGLDHPDSGIEIVFSGLRPGEKLYEELLIGDDSTATEHPRIRRAMERLLPLAQLEHGLEHIAQASVAGDFSRAKDVMLRLVDGYTPDEGTAAIKARESEAASGALRESGALALPSLA